MDADGEIDRSEGERGLKMLEVPGHWIDVSDDGTEWEDHYRKLRTLDQFAKEYAGGQYCHAIGAEWLPKVSESAKGKVEWDPIATVDDFGWRIVIVVRFKGADRLTAFAFWIRNTDKEALWQQLIEQFKCVGIKGD